MKTKLNISIVLGLLFVLFAIQPKSAHAEQTTDNPLTYEIQKSSGTWLKGPDDQKNTDTMKDIKIHYDNPQLTGDIQYRAYNPSVGWTNWISKDKNHNNPKITYITAVQIKLTGQLADTYDINYQPVYFDNNKTLDYMTSQNNGKTAGKESTKDDQPHFSSIVVDLSPKSAPKVQYAAHVATNGWLSYVDDGTSGNPSASKQLEAMRMKLYNADYSGSIEYDANVMTKGWVGTQKDDAIAGTTGKSLALQAIKMQLTGDMAKHYDIYYRAYVSNMGWLGWAKNNEVAGGSDEYKLPMYAYEVKLIKKGDPTPEVKANYPSYLVSDFDAKVANVNGAAGTYDVIVDTKTSPVKQVKIPTWTNANGQDDLIWHVATKQNDGTYKYTVKSTEHKYESGIYSTHAYMDLTNGKTVAHALPNVTLTPELKSKITTDTKNIYVDTSGTEPYKLTPHVAIWSTKNETSQTDLIWYDGKSVKAPISKHSGYGEYIVHVYYYGTDSTKLVFSNKAVVKTSENAVNILDEGKWFPYNQALQIYKSSDTSKNKVEAINKPASAYWTNDNHNLNFKSAADIKSDLSVKATYYKAGKYHGKQLDIVLTFKNLAPRSDYSHWYIAPAKNIYDGFFISGSWDTEVDIEFYEAGTKNLIDMNSEDAFISTNSINRGEYTTYLNSTDNNRIYFTADNNLIRTNAKDLTDTNNWGIWSNWGYHPKLFGNMQSSIGINENFVDKLGDKTFSRNSAVYRLTGKTHQFIFGTNYSDVWTTFSSAAFNVKPNDPEKTVTDVFNDKTGKENDLSNKPITQGKTIIYHVKQQVGQLGVTLISKYKTFRLEDTLSQNLNYQKAELYIDDKLSTEGTKLIQYDAANNKVTFNATDDFVEKNMPFNNETYDLRIYAQGAGTESNPEPTVSNTANVTINNEHTPTKTIQNKYVANALSVTADNIVIDSAPVSKHQFNATVKVSQQYPSPEVLTNTTYQMIIDETKEDGTKIKEAYSQLIHADSLQPQYQIKLPFSTTSKSQKVYYTIRFKTDTPNIQFSSNELKSYGTTASERVISKPTTTISDIVRTSRAKEDKNIKTFTETYNFDYTASSNAKSGYGIPTNLNLTYATQAADLKPDDIAANSPSIVQLKTDVKLLNKDSKVPYTVKGTNGYVNLAKPSVQYDSKTGKTKTTYQYPYVYSKEKSGEIVLESQKDKSAKYADAGSKFYVPIWAEIKPYTLSYVTTKPIGINQYTLNIDTNLNVYAQMQATYDSKTIKFDELNLFPVLPDEIKKSTGWSDSDIKWIKQPATENWNGSKYTMTNGKWVKE